MHRASPVCRCFRAAPWPEVKPAVQKTMSLPPRAGGVFHKGKAAARTHAAVFWIRPECGEQSASRLPASLDCTCSRSATGTTASQQRRTCGALLYLSFWSIGKSCELRFLSSLAKSTNRAGVCKRGRCGEEMESVALTIHEDWPNCCYASVKAPPALLKLCELFKEKTSLCHENSAAGDAYLRGLAVLQRATPIKIAGTANGEALPEVNARLWRLDAMADQIHHRASGRRAGSGIFAVVELHARLPLAGPLLRDHVEEARTDGLQQCGRKIGPQTETRQRFDRGQGHNAEGIPGGGNLRRP